MFLVTYRFEKFAAVQLCVTEKHLWTKGQLCLDIPRFVQHVSRQQQQLVKELSIDFIVQKYK